MDPDTLRIFQDSDGASNSWSNFMESCFWYRVFGIMEKFSVWMAFYYYFDCETWYVIDLKLLFGLFCFSKE
jgi:hypothetical protein